MNEIIIEKKRRQRARKENLIANLYILPIFLTFTVFAAIPMLMSVLFSFTTYNPIKHNNFFSVLPEIFNGIEWYKALFTNLAYSESFKNACLNTLFYLFEVPISITIGAFFAWLINNSKIRGGRVYKMLFYVPVVSSAVAINLVWRYIFDHDYGIVNQMLNTTTIYWLRDPILVKIAINIKNVWARIGACIILISATMDTVDKAIYEAADIDGAGEIKKFFKLTLPHLVPVIFYLLITGINGAMQTYADSKIFAEGAYEAQSLVFFIWQKGIGTYNYGIASAASVLLSIVMFLLTLLQFKISQKGVNE